MMDMPATEIGVVKSFVASYLRPICPEKLLPAACVVMEKEMWDSWFLVESERSDRMRELSLLKLPGLKTPSTKMTKNR